MVGEHTKVNSAGLSTGTFGEPFTGAHVGPANVSTGKMTSVKHEVGRAQWWIPSESVVQHPNVRHLEGEIHLSQSLPPTCDSQFFRVQVRFLLFLTN